MDLLLSLWSTFWNGVLGIIASFLPTVSVSNLNFVENFNDILSYGKQLGFIVPWDTIWFALLIMISCEITIMTIKLIMWVIRITRG